MKKRLILIALSLVLLLSSVTNLVSCSKAPEYAQIEARFIELVEASYDINKVLFGTGLPTLERVYDPRLSVQVYDDDGTRYYYYEIADEELGSIIAYRSSYLSPFVYARKTDTPIDGETPVYADENGKTYYYSIEYTEKKYDFYYTDKDPTDYDYVSEDSQYLSIEQIKIAAEEVYSLDYLQTSVYEALFTGAVASESTQGLSSRYVEYSSDMLGTVLMQSNKYEPLVTETRIFDFSTATMVKPSSKALVNIEVETYLPSSPDVRTTVRVTMVLVDGVWYLDSGTY